MFTNVEIQQYRRRLAFLLSLVDMETTPPTPAALRDEIEVVSISLIADRLCHLASAVNHKGSMDVNCWDPNAI